MSELVALRQLQGSQGWRILLVEMERNLAILERQLMLKKDAKGNKLSDAECDQLRDKYGYLYETKEMPGNLIKFLHRSDNKEEEFDPYAKTVKELQP